MNVEIFLFGLFFSLHKPVARIFDGEVQSREETDRTREGGGLLGCLRMHFDCV